MLIDKYEKDNILRRIPGLTLKLHPELAAIDGVLEDEKLFRMICDDLYQRHLKTLATGRHSTPVKVVLRMLVVWRMYFHAPPDHTTFSVGRPRSSQRRQRRSTNELCSKPWMKTRCAAVGCARMGWWLRPTSINR